MDLMTSDFVEFYDKLYSHINFAVKSKGTKLALYVNTHMYFCAHRQRTKTYHPPSHASSKSTVTAITLHSCTAAVYQNTTAQHHVIATSHTSIFPVFFCRPLTAKATFRSHTTPRGICGGQSITRTASPVSIIPLELHIHSCIVDAINLFDSAVKKHPKNSVS
jgi:hypothetical protein